MESADAFCILPDGLGTTDEIFEVLTYKQLSLLQKPVLFVNVAGYFELWRRLVDACICDGSRWWRRTSCTAWSIGRSGSTCSVG